MDGNDQMTGAESLVRTLVKSGVNVSFSNPGTSEMHYVAALDRVEGMRCVLGLFEGVCSGAADGYYRMADKPAATLLHLGPGLANSAANLHNAKKAGSGIVNIVGEHATHHIKYDTPLTADIEGIAKPFSHWVKTSPNPAHVGKDGAAAVQAARTGCGQIATLILPADCAWTPGGEVAEPLPVPAQGKPSADAVKAAAKALTSGEPAMLLLGGRALRAKGLELAGKIAAKTGCRVQGSGGTARLSRGAGRVQITRLHFVVEQAQAMLKGMKQMVLVGAKEPAAFFAYPGKPSILTPEGCTLTKLCAVEDDCEAALEALAAELGATGVEPAGVAQAKRPEKPTGKFTLDGLGQALGAVLPEGAIVVDESVTTGRGFFPFSVGAPPHDWLNNMGGSIGFGGPVAVGAAVACPDRKVVCMIGDGSAMYTIQSLWTMARDNLDVCVIIFANRSYQILYSQLSDVGAPNPGPRAIDMLTLDRPTLKFVELAKGMGVDGAQAHDLEALNKQLQYAMSTKGPYLIEVVM